MKKELSINKTVIFNVLSVVLIQGVSFFTIPLFSRLLGTANYGIYSTYLAWLCIFEIVLPLSVGSTIPISVNQYSDEERPKYQSTILIIGIVSIFLFSLMLLPMSGILCNLMRMSRSMFVCLLIASLASFIVNFANTRYTYSLQAHKNFIIGVIHSFLNIGISLFLILSMPAENNYWGRIAGGVIAYFLLAIFLLPSIVKDGGLCIKRDYISFCLPLAIPVIFHSLSNTVLNQSDRIMIRDMCSDSQSGVYSLAYSFASILIIVYDAMNRSWTPFYFRYLGEEDHKSLYKHADNYIKLFTLITIGFLLVFKEVYMIFADSTYWAGLSTIPILVFGIYFMFIYSFAVNYEFYIKKTKIMSVITVSAAILNLTLNYILIKKYSIMGAAVATLVSYLYEFAAHYLYVRMAKTGDYPFKLLFYVKPSLLLGVSFLGIKFLGEYPVIRWLIAVGVGLYILYSIKKKRSIF